MTAPLDLDPIRLRYTTYTSAYSQGGWRDAALQAGESADDVPVLLTEVERLREALADLAYDCEGMPAAHATPKMFDATVRRIRLILAGERP